MELLFKIVYWIVGFLALGFVGQMMGVDPRSLDEGVNLMNWLGGTVLMIGWFVGMVWLQGKIWDK